MSNFTIKPDKGKLYTLTLNNKTYTIHQETIIKYNLLNTTDFDSKRLPALLREDTFFQGYDIALKKLSQKAYTPKALKTMLKNQGIPAAVHHRILKTLESYNYYIEETLISMRKDAIVNHLQKGPVILKQTLLNEGFNAALVDDTVAQYKDDDQKAIANAIMKKKLHSFKRIPYNKAYEKLTQFCIQRGFHQSLCLKEAETLLLDYTIDEDKLITDMKQKITKRYTLSDPKDKDKAMRYLLRQGLSYSQIKKVMEE
jgi:SOS response regulatory protein OraA/RecX